MTDDHTPAICDWPNCELEATNMGYCGEHFRRERTRRAMQRGGYQSGGWG